MGSTLEALERYPVPHSAAKLMTSCDWCQRLGWLSLIPKSGTEWITQYCGQVLSNELPILNSLTQMGSN